MPVVTGCRCNVYSVTLHYTHDQELSALRDRGVLQERIKSRYSAEACKKKLSLQLAVLNDAKKESDMNSPGWDWHPLKGQLAGRWSVSVNGNWQLTYAFENGDAILIDYEDYH